MSEWKVIAADFDATSRAVFTVTKGSKRLDHREQEELEALLAGWISIDERLPEHGNWYLVSATTEAPGGGERVTTMAFFDSGDDIGQPLWLAHNDTESNEWREVTHWMPLLEPMPKPPAN